MNVARVIIQNKEKVVLFLQSRKKKREKKLVDDAKGNEIYWFMSYGYRNASRKHKCWCVYIGSNGVQSAKSER